MVEFASFLHNPFDPKWLTKEEQTAIFCFTRAYRFVSKPPMEEELKTFLSNYFNKKENTEENLMKSGLRKVYNKIKEDIIKHKNIGLILYGAYHINSNDTKNLYLCNYLTQNNKHIELNLNNVCQNLLKEYFNIDEINECCKQTPNFDIYYKYILDKYINR